MINSFKNIFCVQVLQLVNLECKYPEMHLQVKKSKVTGECDSCGFNGDLDNVNKVAQFIIKKPPKARQQMGKKV